MKEIRKKSFDAATNAMLIRAHRSKTEVIWDRADAMQPQCGFGRMNICCSDCYEGPCRVNPFAEVPQQTVCGRTQADLISGSFLKQAADGAVAVASLGLEFNAKQDARALQAVCIPKDSMLAPADYSSRVSEVGQTVAKTLQAIREVKEQVYGKTEPKILAANMGALKADAANIILIGHTSPQVVQAVVNAASKHAVPFNVVALCGGEANGGLPVLTNYDSQEMPLLTGAIDLLITGSQCVMPATVSLAKARKVAQLAASSLTDDKKIKDAVEAAAQVFQQRRGKDIQIPDAVEQVHSGYTAANSKQAFKALQTATAKGVLKGMVYLGGCGNIAQTQDAQIVRTAEKLLAEGYVLVTAGCAGAALAKAGMCRPEYASREGLQSIAELKLPPVIHIGACHDADGFLEMARDAKTNGVPVFAVLQEISHNKVLATAVAFASQGIKTYIDLGEAASLPGVKLPGELLPLSALTQLMPKPAAAAAR